MAGMSSNPFDSEEPGLLDVVTRAAGPAGSLPLTARCFGIARRGDLFGWSQNAGMGWDPSALTGKEFLILSTHGGIRAPDGTPIALGYHTGHWEVGLLMEAAAQAFKQAGAIPFAASCTDPCDGRSQGTTAMFDSLPFRNDAATIFRRLIRSLPTRRGVLGVATCDKGLPAMMMALAASHDLSCVLVPGGVTLLPFEGEDAGRVQSIGVRFAHGQIDLAEAADVGCRACASPGGGCQFLGTAATSQVVGEALGMALGHSALAPSGPSHLARHGAPVCARVDGHGTAARHDARHRDRRRDSQRDGRPRGVRRIDEPDPARPRDRSRRRTAAARLARLGCRQPRGAPARRCAAERAPQSPDRAGVHGRRRPGSDAAPAARRTARHARADGRRVHARRAAERVGVVRPPRRASPAAARARPRRSGPRHHVAG